MEKWEEAASRTADIDRVSIVSFERARRIVYIAGTILARKEGRKEGTTGDELGALRSMNYAKSNYISCYTSGKVPLYISREEEEEESRRKNIIINAGKEENCRRIDRISPG